MIWKKLGKSSKVNFWTNVKKTKKWTKKSKKQKTKLVHTSTDHHECCKDLFIYGVGSNVAKSNTSHAGEGKVQRCHITHVFIRTAMKFVVSIYWLINIERALGHFTEFYHPAIGYLLLSFIVSNRVPDACKPMGKEEEDQDEQYKYSSSVF